MDTSSDANSQVLLIAARYDAQVEPQLNTGGRVVLLDSSDALLAGSPLKLAARDGPDLDGNWVTNFNWIRVQRGTVRRRAVRSAVGS